MEININAEWAEIKILVLEDSTKDLELIRYKLSNAGYNLDLTHVENEEELKTTLTKNSFDLIISCFKLSDFDRFGALHISRELCPQTPVICISGVIGEEGVLELLRKGAVDCVLKNNLDRLPLAVKRSLAEVKVKSDYQKTAEALRESEEMIRSIYNAAPAGIGVVINRMLKNVNERVCEMTGYTKIELIDKNARILYPSQEEYEFVGKEKYIQISEKGTGEVETRWQKKDGSIIHVLLASTLIDIKDHSKGVTFTALDITQRKLAEKALCESERKFRSLTENTSDVIAIIDLQGTITYMSRKIEDRTGYKKDEIEGVNIQKILTPESFNVAMNCIQKRLIGEYINNPLEVEIVSKSGLVIPFELNTTTINNNGKITGIQIVARDITERKAINEALKQSEEKYRRIAENVTDVVWITDLEMNPTYISPSVERIFGIKPDEFLKHPLTKTYPPASLEKFQKLLAVEFIREQDPNVDKKRIIHLEVERYYSDRSIGWDAISASFIYDENNRPIAIQGVSRDITKQKHAEKALQESQEMMVNSQTVAHICSYSTNLNLIELEKSSWVCSPEFYKIFGIDQSYPHTIEGWAGFIHPDYREKIVAYHEFVVREKKSFNYEYKIIRINDGAERWVHGTGELELDEKGTPIRMRGAIQDITERKRTEMIKQTQFNIASAVIGSKDITQLFNSIRNELNKIIDSNNILIAIYSEETGKLKAILDKDQYDKILEWPAEKSLTGYVIKQNRPMLLRKNEILSLQEKGIIEPIGTISEAWLGVPLIIKEKVIGAVVVQNYDNPNVYDKYSIKIMELVAHLLSMYIDRMRAEEKANKLFRAVEQSSVSVVITNKNGEIEYVNPFFTELTGYSFEEVRARNPKILKSDHHSTKFYQDLWETILSGKDWEGEMLNKKKNGDLYWEEAVISPIVNHDGVITNFVAIKQDITEKKKMLEELVSAKQKAEESDLLKTEFLNNMSHEIRTPMNGIIGFSDMLDKPDLSDEKRKYYSKIVQNSSYQLLRIIDDILEISTLGTKQEKTNETEFCLNDFLMELFSIFNLKSKERNIPLYLKKALHDDQSYIISDKTKLNKILGNLLENALKFTNVGYIEFGYLLEKPNLILYVKDTGIGIFPKNHKIIFEPFTQEDKGISRKHGGLGLGLSISKENTKLLGGDITVESEKGKGSVFYVTIPYKLFNNSNVEISKSSPDSSTINEKHTILIAEDEEVNYLYIETLFETISGGKYKLIHAKNGREAFDICMKNKKIDLVLMDIKMPVMNGHEATKMIKSKFPNLPIIAQTAYSTESDKEKALKHGCDNFISKPISQEKLFELINKYLTM